MVSADTLDHDVDYRSNGLAQCLDLVRDALARPRATDRPAPDGWQVGEGVALTMIHTVPPRGHIADSRVALRADGTYELVFGTAEFGNGTSTVHGQVAATALATTVDRIVLRQSDTRNGGHDTGAYGSTGTVVAARATLAAAEALRAQILAFAAEQSGASGWTLAADAVIRAGRRWSLVELAAAARAAGRELAAGGHSDGSPRSIAFNVHGFRVAVDPRTGEIRILKSVQAADAGRVINPMQCRAQIEGGVAQALGAALYEELRIDRDGRAVNPSLRDYHVPAFADVPYTEVYLVETPDAVGPYGAKSMSESPYNPVLPALANALRDATGIRVTTAPLRADRVWEQLAAAVGTGSRE
jgi:putative selenate reductase molybdopterin-binding subunit